MVETTITVVVSYSVDFLLLKILNGNFKILNGNFIRQSNIIFIEIDTKRYNNLKIKVKKIMSR